VVNEELEKATFAGLGLRPELVETLARLGYEEPTPVQREAMAPLLEGRDLVGQAATGTGKTAAFALPLLQRFGAGSRSRQPFGLVLVPTRELAIQVAEAIHRYGRDLGARVLPIYGGQPIGRQLRTLQQGVDFVVATPGRALDHLRRGTLRLDGISTVVLDEADEMLDMGFAEDIEAILAATSPDRQTVLFSATMPPRIDGIARAHLRDPVRLRIAAAAPRSDEAAHVRQTAYIVRRPYKVAALSRILDVEAPAAAIIFCRTRTEVDELTETLSARGYRAEALHGGMSQEQRDRVMGRLRAGTAELLVATDVAARGLDIEHLTHVFNFDVPSAPESYVHRVGRVGRAGRAGVAITLAEPREHRLLKEIERVAKRRIDVERIPTVADLRTRRLELTRAALRETLVEDGYNGFTVVVESLADEFDVMQIAAAAVKLAFEAGGVEPAEEDEIPDAPPMGGPQPERGRRGDRQRGGYAERQGEGGGQRGGRDRRPRGAGGDTAVVLISAGRDAGIRPQDLVGAIANEAGVAGRDIGAIRIDDHSSMVEVNSAVADEVVAALRATTLKGRKVSVRLRQ
jgi:ATP-dependent RNA helicase DeaD